MNSLLSNVARAFFKTSPHRMSFLQSLLTSVNDCICILRLKTRKKAGYLDTQETLRGQMGFQIMLLILTKFKRIN